MKYRVRFSRPNGTEAWLGESYQGGADNEKKAVLLDEQEAQAMADERNRWWWCAGYKYWVVPEDKQ
jgi:hypothetical protein